MQSNKNIEQLLRFEDMVCLGGEEELSNMLMGNFAAFNRVDCDPPLYDVFRWGWESWRSAVGSEIARIYPHAIDIMNVGAQVTGERMLLAFYVGYVLMHWHIYPFFRLTRYRRGVAARDRSTRFGCNA